jgi:hypothetical protein
MSDPNYMREQLHDYPAFREWLDGFNPDWECEYSGHILEMLEAWKAAAKRAEEFWPSFMPY